MLQRKGKFLKRFIPMKEFRPLIEKPMFLDESPVSYTHLTLPTIYSV